MGSNRSASNGRYTVTSLPHKRRAVKMQVIVPLRVGVATRTASAEGRTTTTVSVNDAPRKAATNLGAVQLFASEAILWTKSSVTPTRKERLGQPFERRNATLAWAMASYVPQRNAARFPHTVAKAARVQS